MLKNTYPDETVEVRKVIVKAALYTLLRTIPTVRLFKQKDFSTTWAVRL